MKDLFIVAHPDDAEVMLGHAIAASTQAHVIVATNGEASTVDMRGNGFCCIRQAYSRIENGATPSWRAIVAASILGAS